ncbi:MAG: C4-type zinc ribbon domain-containing protein [Desulfobacterium sp.]
MAAITKNEMDVLIRLQTAETETVRILSYLKTIDKEKDALESKLTTFVKALDKKKASLAAVVKANKDMELEIQTTDDRIKKSNETLRHVTTDTEYQVLQREIDNNKKRLESLENDLLKKFEDKDVQEKIVQEQMADVEQATAKIRSDQAAIDKKCEDDRELLETYRQQREDIGASLSPEFLKVFNEISETSGGLAVVEVRKEVCRGCFMNIPPQLYIEVQRGKDLILCPQCNRILYFSTVE